MAKLSKNLKMEGVFSSEVPDTTGETLRIKGSDISHLVGGYVNTEHLLPTDSLDKKTPEELKGFQSVVGIVTAAKKVFGPEDCSTPKETEAWQKLKRPLIYGHLEIFTDPDSSHPNSQAVAAIAKALHNHQTGKKLGLSVEGSTVKRNGQILENTVLKGIAVTLKPANRSAYADISQSQNSIQKSEYSKLYKGEGEPLYKSVDMSYVSVISTDLGIKAALNKLQKALTAGGSAAPGSLTDGAALQTSSLQKIAKHLGKRKPKKEEIKKAFPSVSDSEAQALEKALKNHDIEQKLQVTSEIYNNLKKR